MKRHFVHSAFAIVAASSVLIAAVQWFELWQRQSINRAVEAVPEQMDRAQLQASPADVAAEVSLARSAALLRSDEFDQAEEILGTLAQDKSRPDIAHIAQYNLANGYLREALDLNKNPGRKIPLIELSKQRYRDLLRTDSQHWDARFNLELALRLSPENSEFDIDARGKPIKSVQVIFPGFEDRDLP